MMFTFKNGRSGKQSMFYVLFTQMKRYLFPAWTVVFWGVAWFLFLSKRDDLFHSVLFVLSWPALLFTIFPLTFDCQFLVVTVPIFILVFITYWFFLLKLIGRRINNTWLCLGVTLHLLGGFALVWRILYFTVNNQYLSIRDAIIDSIIMLLYLVGYSLLRRINGELARCSERSQVQA